MPEMVFGESRRDWIVLILIALVGTLLVYLPSFNTAWDYFRDELYYLACADHPDLGYVDHPPLAPLLLRLITAVFGTSIPAVRLFPALAFGACLVLAGRIAKKLGGGLFAQVMAAVSVFSSGLLQTLAGFFSMNAFETLLWTLCVYFFIVIVRDDKPWYWIHFGIVFGLALENKHTIALSGIAFVLGLLLFDRRHFRTKYLWLGLGAALLLFIPNIVWQGLHGFPSLAFYLSATVKNVPTAPWDVALQQILYNNPAGFPVWALGLWFFLAGKTGRDLRPVAIVFLVLLGAMVLTASSRPDRMASVYPALFAGGACFIDEKLASVKRGRLRYVALAPVTAFGLLMLPLSVPWLDPPGTARYGAASGIVPRIERHSGGNLSLIFADRLGWREAARETAAVYHSLSPEEKTGVVVFAENYGLAGAIDRYGGELGLPPARSTHNNYYLWGPGKEEGGTVVFIGVPLVKIISLFENARIARLVEIAYTRELSRCPIVLARGPKAGWAEMFSANRHFE